jgi:transposase
MPRKYDKEFKINTVKLVFEENLNYTQASRDLGIKLSTLQRWVKESKSWGSIKVFPGSGNQKIEVEERRHSLSCFQCYSQSE